jgi:ABC-type sugar transport system ATPase subunit
MLLVAEDGSFRIKLPDALRTRVLNAKAQKVDIGIRPIHIDVVEELGDGDSVMTGKVVTYESLGEEGQIAATVGDASVLVVTSPTLRLERGQSVTLRLHPERINLFDATTQQAI